MDDAQLEPISLAPTDERGGSVLVVGGTAAARNARVAEWVSGVASGSAVLVRVAADRRVASGLDEAVSVAVEAALGALRAPGGLYDEAQSGPLAALAGWLFRARAVGRRGVILVIDEADAWTESRGADGRRVEATALLERALTESARRPLSLLCSVRGADASANAALPAETVARFGHVDRLPAVATVNRNVQDLVAELSGRSFTLNALTRALAGWLELPEPVEETVVVFNESSEGAPEPAMEWRPARGDTTERPSEPGIEAEKDVQLGDGWADALHAAIQVRDALRDTVRSGERPRSFRQFERAFREGIAVLPDALVALARGERALGVPSTRLHRAGAERLARFEQDFAEYYPAAYESWLSGSARPTMLSDVPARIVQVAAERGARGTAFVLMTGLRMDFWLRLRDRVLPRVPGLALIDEGVHWAARPTKPSTQRELVARGLERLAAELPARDEPASPRTFEEAMRPRREHLGRTEVLRIEGYAAELARGGSRASVLERVEQAMPGVLLSLCGRFPTRTVIGLAGDVGMRETSGAPEAQDGGRFQFGGDSPFEAIVPYAVLLWG